MESRRQMANLLRVGPFAWLTKMPSGGRLSNQLSVLVLGRKLRCVVRIAVARFVYQVIHAVVTFGFRDCCGTGERTA